MVSAPVDIQNRCHHDAHRGHEQRCRRGGGADDNLARHLAVQTQMHSARRHIADARLHGHARTPFHNLERAVIVQPLGKGCNKGGRHMLHQEDTGGHVRRNLWQHLLQRRRPAGGDSDDDRPFSGDVLKRRRALAAWYGFRRSRLRCRRSTMPREAAALSFEISSSATRPMLFETVPSGLPTKSKAPNSRHSKVVAVPCWVSDETITTGQIFSCRMIWRAVIAVQFRHVDVHRDDIGPQFPRFRYGVLAIPCEPHQIKVGRRRDDSFEGLPHQGGIVRH